MRAPRAAGVLLLLGHLLFLAWYSLRPLDVPWVMPANWHPFAAIRADLDLGWRVAALRICRELALPAPLGVLLPLVHGRLRVSPLASLLRTTAAGALLALTVELLQTDVPGQVVDVDSLLLATAGVALAHLAVVPASRSWLRRRAERGAGAVRPQEEPSQGLTPTIPRVGIAP
ncbi:MULTISPECIES: VanZ family protein [unclassified Streptomyces]|uniref:VanZ family protein n=1 Tax=unclassified Streptomyces TaxID=2593676 RepID=UPI003D739E77